MRRLSSALTRIAPAPRRITTTTALRTLAVFAALLAYTGMAAADPGTATATTTSTLFTPLQQDFCSTEGGQLLEAFGGILVVIFFFGIVAAIMIAGAIEALPLTGWFNQIGFSMMGKIPIAMAFVFIAFSMLQLVDGTFGLTAPSCVPIVG